ncbi:MAG: hypothetical protein J6U68_04585 [Clostridia bacterium]|nr:hypothetical protein [Clostridia bacterium]
MKKLRLFALITVIATAVTAFSACSKNGGTESSFGAVFNKDCSAKEKIVESASEIELLRGYDFIESKGEFMLFTKGDSESGLTRAVFSTRNKRVVHIAEASSDESVEVKFYSGIPAFTVSRVTIGGCADAAEIDVSYELYDATGTRISESKTEMTVPVRFADVLLAGGVSYEIDEKTGALSKGADVSVELDAESCVDWNDKYFYIYGEAVKVYDRSFNCVYEWALPSDAVDAEINALNDGKILAQYRKLLAGDAEKYDIYEIDEESGVGEKFELTTVLLDPEKKKEKTLKLEYLIRQLTTGDELIRISDDNGTYRDDIENLAYVTPITEDSLDMSEATYDVVLMDNDGKVEKSLKLIDGQDASLPTRIGKNVYMLATEYGVTILDIDGNVISEISDLNVEIVGENIVSDGIVYNLAMEEVYSLHENEAEFLTGLGGTVIVKKGGETEYDVIAIRGSEIKEILKYSELEGDAVELEMLGDSGCYAICNKTRSEYSYYNPEHKLLHKSSVQLVKTATDFLNGVSVYSAATQEGNSYYVFY